MREILRLTGSFVDVKQSITQSFPMAHIASVGWVGASLQPTISQLIFEWWVGRSITKLRFTLPTLPTLRSLLGAEGLEHVALTCHANTTALVKKLTDRTQVNQAFKGPFFHETVLQLEKPVDDVLRELATYNILGGYNLGKFYPELGNSLLVCATEMRTQIEIDNYSEKLQMVIKK